MPDAPDALLRRERADVDVRSADDKGEKAFLGTTRESTTASVTGHSRGGGDSSGGSAGSFRARANVAALRGVSSFKERAAHKRQGAKKPVMLMYE